MSDDEEAVRREASVAADNMWREFEKLGDRLDELARDYDDEECREVFSRLEEFVTPLDDLHYEAQEAIDK